MRTRLGAGWDGAIVVVGLLSMLAGAEVRGQSAAGAGTPPAESQAPGVTAPPPASAPVSYADLQKECTSCPLPKLEDAVLAASCPPKGTKLRQISTLIRVCADPAGKVVWLDVYSGAAVLTEPARKQLRDWTFRAREQPACFLTYWNVEVRSSDAQCAGAK